VGLGFGKKNVGDPLPNISAPGPKEERGEENSPNSENGKTLLLRGKKTSLNLTSPPSRTCCVPARRGGKTTEQALAGKGEERETKVPPFQRCRGGRGREPGYALYLLDPRKGPSVFLRSVEKEKGSKADHRSNCSGGEKEKKEENGLRPRVMETRKRGNAFFRPPGRGGGEKQGGKKGGEAAVFGTGREERNRKPSTNSSGI